jgi:hypothetical protein
MSSTTTVKIRVRCLSTPFSASDISEVTFKPNTPLSKILRDLRRVVRLLKRRRQSTYPNQSCSQMLGPNTAFISRCSDCTLTPRCLDHPVRLDCSLAIGNFDILHSLQILSHETTKREGV